MTLDLEPEVENSLRTHAAAEGVSPEIFFTRLLAGYQPAPINEPEWKVRLRDAQQRSQAAFAASGKTEDEIGDEIDGQLPALRRAALQEYHKKFPAENSPS